MRCGDLFPPEGVSVSMRVFYKDRLFDENLVAEFDVRLAPRSALTLALLVLGVLADDHDFAMALDDLALFAHGLDGRSDFHCISSYLLLHTIRPRVTS